MNISKITVAQLAALAQESEQVDPIDWGELSIEEEQIREQALGRVFRRRLARTHHAVNLNQCIKLRQGRINSQGI